MFFACTLSRSRRFFLDGLFDERYPGFLARLQARSLPPVERALRALAAMRPTVSSWGALPQLIPRPIDARALEEWIPYLHALVPHRPEPRMVPCYIHDAVWVLRAIRRSREYRHFGEHTSALSLAPALMKALSHSAITAWLLPNDADARLVYQWMVQVAEELAGRISLLSFDNASSLSGFPVSTIDFGFDHLDYSALHFLLQDIPVKRNRYGDIPSVPHVVGRNSVR